MLLTPRSSFIFIKHQSFKGKTSCSEKYYGTNYNDKKFTSTQLELWESCFRGDNKMWDQKIGLPQRNPFIPTDFSIRCEDPQHRFIPKDQSFDLRLKSNENGSQMDDGEKALAITPTIIQNLIMPGNQNILDDSSSQPEGK
jgi:secreted Zn-dependent insulinase-like peptidase